jgi:hypothetical protein
MAAAVDGNPQVGVSQLAAQKAAVRQYRPARLDPGDERIAWPTEPGLKEAVWSRQCGRFGEPRHVHVFGPIQGAGQRGVLAGSVEAAGLEFELVRYLYEHRERVCKGAELGDAVWGAQRWATSMLHKLVHRLKGKLEPDPEHPRYVQTVPAPAIRHCFAIRAATTQSTSADVLLGPHGCRSHVGPRGLFSRRVGGDAGIEVAAMAWASSRMPVSISAGE